MKEGKSLTTLKFFKNFVSVDWSDWEVGSLGRGEMVVKTTRQKLYDYPVWGRLC